MKLQAMIYLLIGFVCGFVYVFGGLDLSLLDTLPEDPEEANS